MTQRTCTIEGCDRKHAARGFCKKHYMQQYQAGSLQPLPKNPEWHWITDPDADSGTGHCSICGPTRVFRRPRGKGWTCEAKKKEYAKKRDRSKRRPDGRASSGDGFYTLRERRLARYGLTDEQLDAMERLASGRCMICDAEFPDEAGYNVDHCHETQLVRGLLCRRCNFGLGWFEDDPARLLAAYFYLTGSGKAAV